MTNGLGGYACGSLAGANTRRYHGLLVASLDPPVRRMLLVARLEEEAATSGGRFSLFTNVFRDRVEGLGHLHLLEYTQNPFPRFRYLLGGKILDKSVFMIYGQNTTVVTYSLVAADEPLELSIRVLINCRNYHWVSAPGSVRFRAEEIDCGCRVTDLSGSEVATVVRADEGLFTGEGRWTAPYYYPAEAERGLEAEESHFALGSFTVRIDPGQERGIVVTAERAEGGRSVVLPEARARERGRLEAVVSASGLTDPFARELARAADAFIVRRRSTGTLTVIAGYPWFADWSRDTLVALPGLALVTRRYDDARSILAGFASLASQSKGWVPNTFDEVTGEPFYNSIDAPLWLVYAVHKYLEHTGDVDFVVRELYGPLRRVLESFLGGTRFGIGVDPRDGLVRGGRRGVQLTWMDAKPGDWVVTPRRGKPVEVNALWYMALRVMARLAALSGDTAVADRLQEAAARAARSFVGAFWSGELGYLCDCIGSNGEEASGQVTGEETEEKQDRSLRPNQLVAVGVARDLLPASISSTVLRKVVSDLLVPCGVRTLSPTDPCYRGRFTGDQSQRDAAYHQGTAWAWLLGPLVSGLVAVWGRPAVGLLQSIFAAVRHHLWEAGIGQISEVFEGDPPHEPKGCFAQAWSVGEVLRAYVEDYLNLTPEGGGPR